MYNPKSHKAEEFICHQEILDTLEYAQKNKNNIEVVDKILEKARLKKGLNHREAGRKFMHLLEKLNRIITVTELYFLRPCICPITV